LPGVLTQSPALHATIQLYEASEGVPARLKAMAIPDRVPHTTTDASPKQHKTVSPPTNRNKNTTHRNLKVRGRRGLEVRRLSD
jgi:hypothetical protein